MILDAWAEEKQFLLTTFSLPSLFRLSLQKPHYHRICGGNAMINQPVLLTFLRSGVSVRL